MTVHICMFLPDYLAHQLLNRNDQVYFRIKTLKFSGNMEKCTYPILHYSIPMVSQILIRPKHSPNLVLNALRDESNKIFAESFECNLQSNPMKQALSELRKVK